MKFTIILILLILFLPTEPEASNEGIGELILGVTVVTVGTTALVTSAIPLLFKEENNDYSYLKSVLISYGISFGGGLITALVTQSAPPTAIVLLSGVIAGPIIEYQLSKKSNISIKVLKNFDRNDLVLSYSF